MFGCIGTVNAYADVPVKKELTKIILDQEVNFGTDAITSVSGNSANVTAGAIADKMSQKCPTITFGTYDGVDNQINIADYVAQGYFKWTIYDCIESDKIHLTKLADNEVLEKSDNENHYYYAVLEKGANLPSDYSDWWILNAIADMNLMYVTGRNSADHVIMEYNYSRLNELYFCLDSTSAGICNGTWVVRFTVNGNRESLPAAPTPGISFTGSAGNVTATVTGEKDGYRSFWMITREKGYYREEQYECYNGYANYGAENAGRPGITVMSPIVIQLFNARTYGLTNDGNGPEITFISINPKKITVGDKVTVRLRIQDETGVDTYSTNGIWYTDVYTTIWNNRGPAKYFAYKRISGDDRDGIYECTFTMEHAENKKLRTYVNEGLGVVASDVFGNEGEEGTIVSILNPDAPTITDIKVPTSVVRGSEFKLTARITDPDGVDENDTNFNINTLINGMPSVWWCKAYKW